MLAATLQVVEGLDVLQQIGESRARAHGVLPWSRSERQPPSCNPPVHPPHCPRLLQRSWRPAPTASRGWMW